MGECELRERIRGGLIGIAYGDAFGMPSEMWGPEQIREKLGHLSGLRGGHPDNGISSALVRGEVTDDTVNSMLVMEMLCENHGKVDAGLFIRKLKGWIAGAEKSASVVGPSTKRAIELLEQGVPMQETGKTGTTNGGAMKILPVGFAAGIRWARASDEETAMPWTSLLDEVAALCMPTHYTSAAISAAAAVAAGGAAAVAGLRDPDEIFAYMVRMAEAGERYGCPACGPSVAARMKLGQAYILKEREAAVRSGQAGAKTEEKILDFLYRCIGTGLPSAESVPAAALLFWLAAGDPRVCAGYTANIGGDTDTMGAIACGLCGAYAGAGAFDGEDVALLERVNGLAFGEWTDRLLRCV